MSVSPILIDTGSHTADNTLLEWVLACERSVPSVTWIDSHHSLPNLGAMLTNRLACEINDGDQVVLRFWDPRILLGLSSALDAEQRRHFFAPVATWTA